MNKDQEKLKPCPFCGEEAELKPGMEIPPTLEEALEQEPSVRCSNGQCGARYIVVGLKEWNTRALNELDEAKLSNIIKENIVYRAEGWEKLQKAIMSTFGVKTKD